MRGYTHALSGAAGWVAVTSAAAPATGWYVQPTPVIAGGALICAGFALWPDSDHINGTIAHSLPPVSNVLTRAIFRLTGGHRHATHSPLGVLVFTALVSLATLLTTHIHGRTFPLGSTIVVSMCLAFAADALHLTRGLGFRGIARDLLESSLGAWVISVGGAVAITWWLHYEWTWLTWCAALGTLIHNIGDTLTPEGCPWLWPWNPKRPKWWPKWSPLKWGNNGYFHIPLLGHVELKSDKKSRLHITREDVLGAVLAFYIALVAVWPYLTSSNSPLFHHTHA